MSDLISVIIPAYNTGERIKATIESIINQDYKNLEIILVDDASTDNTLEVARNVLENSNRPFKILNHENNQGVSSARNDGLDSANGKFISFIDSDDLILKNFLSHLHKLAIENNSDLVMCGIMDRFSNPNRDITPNYRLTSHFLKNGYDIIINRKILPFLVPCSLYSKDFLDRINIKFLDGCPIGEDIEFQNKVMTHAKNVTISDENLYIYVHYDSQTTAKLKMSGIKSKEYMAGLLSTLRWSIYVMKQSRLQKIHELKNYAEKILLPDAIIKFFTIYAKQHNQNKFNNLFKKRAVKKILCNALNLYTLFKKLEIFFKALLISIAPKIYYWTRS